MDNITSKENLIRKIQELGFTAVDLNLFLDTHPNNAQALQDYNNIVNSLSQLRQVYVQNFGPLLNFGFSISVGNYWNWVADTEKWPWEGNVEV